MTAYDNARRDLERAPRTWLITGVGGFIGSNLYLFMVFGARGGLGFGAGVPGGAFFVVFFTFIFWA